MGAGIGVIGGMGPLASAAFMRSLYGMYRGRVEQALPAVTLYSDPSVGDRTAVFLNGGDTAPLLQYLERSICRLRSDGVDRIVICCMTAHHLLPMLPQELRKSVTSLVHVGLKKLCQTRKRCLVACSTGTKRLKIFEQQDAWNQVAHLAVFPTDEEQKLLHSAIYRLKREHVVEPLHDVLMFLAAEHQTEAILSGCTELHLLSPAYAGRTRLNEAYEFVDPLTAVARMWMEDTDAATICA